MTTSSPDPRRVRRLVNRLAEVLMFAAGPSDAAFYRASGDVRCDGCGMPYSMHAHDPFERWLTVLCNGQRVKL